MRSSRPHIRTSSVRDAVIVAALCMVITALRFAVADPIEAIGFLYVVPIALAAIRFGWRGGAALTFAASALTVMWALSQEVPLGLVGYVSRIGAFAVVGFAVGLEAERIRRLERARQELVDELRELATTDQLTGLPNRRAWDERLALETRRAARTQEPLTVAAIDLDNLKEVNDTFGHEQGDRLIKQWAASWSSALRETDYIARVGGDEFLVLLPNCTTAGARLISRRMRRGALGVAGFSFGAAAWDGAETAPELVARADAAMYGDKATGRRDPTRKAARGLRNESQRFRSGSVVGERTVRADR